VKKASHFSVDVALLIYLSYYISTNNITINLTSILTKDGTIVNNLAENIFPSRKIKWQQTFEGIRVRLVLLPDNPHLQQEIRVIRSVLGITDD
jgi:hypothetical protein